MIFYTEYQFDNLSTKTVKYKKREYDDNIITLDIETTSYFIKNGRVELFDKTKLKKEKKLDKGYYDDAIKQSYMYIWQMSINGVAVYGRKMSELDDFLTELHNRIKRRMVIYIHNLSFEFQFLCNIMRLVPFVRKSRHPIFANCEELNAEFRCSYFLSNMSLADMAKSYKLKTQKMVGDLDYNVIRNSLTPLTDEEMKYCENDVLVLNDYISFMKEQYKNVCKIPYTQTGRLRREFKKMFNRDMWYYDWIKKAAPKTVEEFELLVRAYQGGYTHANYARTGITWVSNKIDKNIGVDGIYSRDLTSSYPTSMIAFKYPCTRFYECRDGLYDVMNLTDEKCFIIDITFYDLECQTCNTYLSKSKAIEIDWGEYDNGRVRSAKEIRYVLLDVDLDIVKQSYKWSGYKLNHLYSARKKYLDKRIIDYLLTLYENKTMYKGDDAKLALYLQSKQFINAVYGMCVCNNIIDEVTYSNDYGWGVKKLTYNDIETALSEQYEKCRNFTLYSTGIYVSAYSRANLWKLILKLDKDVIYCDTDSIKYINKSNDKYFKEYNKWITTQLRTALKEHKLDPKRLSPLDPSGTKRPLGIWDEEPRYDEFKTLGAKKYCYSIDGKLGITLSGVNKKYGVNALTCVDDFDIGLVFDTDNAGKSIVCYNDNQIGIDITDCYGNTEYCYQKYGINLMPTTYELGLSQDYKEFLMNAPMYTEPLSYLTDRGIK